MRLNFNKPLKCDGCGNNHAAKRKYRDGSTSNLCRSCARGRDKAKQQVQQEAHRVSQKLKTEAGSVCQDCGKKCESGELDAHHKTPLYLGGTNDPSNFALLCKDCHLKAHRQLGEIHYGPQ